METHIAYTAAFVIESKTIEYFDNEYVEVLESYSDGEKLILNHDPNI